MSTIDATKYAGQVLKTLIKENYNSQEEFAYDYGIDLRTLSRYVNEGIGKLWKVQELAEFFGVQMYVFCPPLPENGNKRKNTSNIQK